MAASIGISSRRPTLTARSRRLPISSSALVRPMVDHFRNSLTESAPLPENCENSAIINPKSLWRRSPPCVARRYSGRPRGRASELSALLAFLRAFIESPCEVANRKLELPNSSPLSHESSNYGAVPATSLVGFSRELMARGSRVSDLGQEGACHDRARQQSSNGGSRDLARWLGSRVSNLGQEGACLDYARKQSSNSGSRDSKMLNSWIET